MPITLPPKPWTLRLDGSANSIRDSSGSIIAMIPCASTAEHILERCNETVVYTEEDMQEKEKEITNLEERLEVTEDDAKEDHEKMLDKIYALEDELQQANKKIKELQDAI